MKKVSLLLISVLLALTQSSCLKTEELTVVGSWAFATHTPDISASHPEISPFLGNLLGDFIRQKGITITFRKNKSGMMGGREFTYTYVDNHLTFNYADGETWECGAIITQDNKQLKLRIDETAAFIANPQVVDYLSQFETEPWIFHIKSVASYNRQ